MKHAKKKLKDQPPNRQTEAGASAFGKKPSRVFSTADDEVASSAVFIQNVVKEQ